MTAGRHEGAAIRVGGDSADSSCWHAAAAAAPRGCCAYNLTAVRARTAFMGGTDAILP